MRLVDLLQVYIATVRQWSRNGMLKSHRPGSKGQRGYRLEDILALREREVGL